jgi:hypothetical protein
MISGGQKMKREDLIKKLEDTESPQAELPSYQQRLKTALLQADYLHRRQREVTILKVAKDAIMRSLISRQPVWKTATIAVLVVALILGLSFAISSLSGDSVYAQAEEIAKNSPEVLTIVGKVGEVQVIEISEIEGTVIAQGENGSALAKVNLETREVTDIVSFADSRAAAIEIAKADPCVQALLDTGAIISEASCTFAVYLWTFTGDAATGEPELDPELGELLEAWVIVKIVDSENVYSAHVDLIEGKVTSIEITSVTAAAIEIAKADPRVQALLDAGAIISEDPTLVFTLYVSHGAFLDDAATGEPELDPELGELLGVGVLVRIVDNENVYSVHVDLIEGKVTSIIETYLDAAGNPLSTTTVTRNYKCRI